MAGITLSSEIRQNANTIVWFDTVQPNESQSARIELAFRAFDVQFHYSTIRDAQQDHGVIGRLVTLFGFVDDGVVPAFEIVNVAGIPSQRKLVDYRDGVPHPHRIFLLFQGIEYGFQSVICNFGCHLTMNNGWLLREQGSCR
jgi:hypothetical protein